MALSVEQLTQCWFLAGPTAAGKSATSLLLARQLGAEIVSMDSMAIYRTMDIGTAKATPTEQQAVPHHMIDIVDPHQEFSVADYVHQSRVAVAEILQRGNVPLFVGGTGLYLRSLLRGVFDGPEADWDLRAELEDQANGRGSHWLHEQLKHVDPESAARLHPNDVRRVIRAIEVYRLTGKPLSRQQSHSPRPLSERPVCVAWLEPPRDWLYDRIDRRVDTMMSAGLLQEVANLMEQTPRPGKTARQALGYRELIAYLEGEVRLSEAVQQVKVGTRQFAKRQHTWFRGLEECRNVTLDGSQTTDKIVEKVMDLRSI